MTDIEARLLPDPPPGMPDIRTEDRTGIDPEKVAAMLAARDLAGSEEAEALDRIRTALTDARALLLAYGTPEGLSFVETYSAVQTAALDYRDAGTPDPVCEEHLQWITARTGQITASALYALGALQ